jgi:ATP-binding cassette, subfamily B, bacterial
LKINAKNIKADSANIRKAIRFVYECDKRLCVARLILIGLQSVLPLASLYMLKLLVDCVTFSAGAEFTDQGISQIWLYAGLFCSIFLFTRFSNIIVQLFDDILVQKLINFISNLIHKKSVELDLSYYDNSEYHDTFHRAQQEANHRPVQILNNLTSLITNSISIAGIVLLLASLSWIVILVLIFAGLPSLITKLAKSKKLYEWRKKNTTLFRKTNYLSMLMTHRAYSKELRIFSLGNYFQKKFNHIRTGLVKEIFRISKKLAKYDLLSSVFEVAALLLVIVILSHKAFAGAITIGSFVMYFEAFRKGQSFLQTMVASLSGIYNNKLFLNNLFEFLELKPHIQSPAKPVPFPMQLKEGIKFENVSFSYPGSKKLVLDNISFQAKPGKITIIKGNNGAGKTTVIKLLCRLYDCVSGAIYIDGINIKHFEIQELRKNISVIFQDFAQYDFTVRQNITLGNIEKTDNPDQIKQAAEKSCAQEVIENLPDRYDTLLGKYFKGGQELSMGQWQRMALGRTLYKDSSLLILDEPTSWIDVKAEKLFYEKLDSLKHNRALLIINHNAIDLSGKLIHDYCVDFSSNNSCSKQFKEGYHGKSRWNQRKKG